MYVILLNFSNLYIKMVYLLDFKIETPQINVENIKKTL